MPAAIPTPPSAVAANPPEDSLLHWADMCQIGSNYSRIVATGNERHWLCPWTQPGWWPLGCFRFDCPCWARKRCLSSSPNSHPNPGVQVFRKRPGSAPAPVADAQPAPDRLHGFCFLARQSALVFGPNRREPSSGRPAVSVTKRDDWVVLLPSTRQPNAEFFHLTPKDCFATRARQTTRLTPTSARATRDATAGRLDQNRRHRYSRRRTDKFRLAAACLGTHG